MAFAVPHPEGAATEPWSIAPHAPTLVAEVGMPAPRGVPRQTAGHSLPHGVAHAWLRFYQEHLSGLGAARCPMAPSCSRYSMQAITRHGVLVGIVMTADRLFREADEKRWARLVGTGAAARYWDPLEENDFWWNEP